MSAIDWDIRRYRSGVEPEEQVDRVAVELPLEINIDGLPLVTLMRLPGMDEELALGFCLTERVIADIAQVRRFSHGVRLGRAAGEGEGPAGDDHDRWNVVKLELESPGECERFSAPYAVRTVCGGTDVSAIENRHEGKIASRLQVSEKVIYGLGEKMTSRQEVFKGTAGAHGAGIFDASGGIVVAVEDVGRHNALDKAVGWCALRRIPLDDKVLVLSGRISCEMALKAMSVGIPVLISMAAPTSLVLRVADKAGLTVVGFSNGRRFSVYTHPWRIVP